MYEDRLIVEVYILKMMQNVYQIREILNADDAAQQPDTVKAAAENIKATYNLFIKTRLTEKEKSTASDLITQIKAFEKINVKDRQQALVLTDKILSSLNSLTEIQLDESNQIMKQVESQYATIKALSQFAFAIIIIILIVLQVLVFSGESIIPLFKPKDPRLN